MAMNRIQFQSGMSLFEHFQHFGTETQCAAALERTRWPNGFRCPRCGGAAHCVLRGCSRKTFQCNACHHQTSLIAGTLFEGTKLGLTVWFLAIHLIGEAKTGLSALAPETRSRGQLSHRLADPSQADAGDGRARERHGAVRNRAGRRRLPWR
jgi:hypothetical protein